MQHLKMLCGRQKAMKWWTAGWGGTAIHPERTTEATKMKYHSLTSRWKGYKNDDNNCGINNNRNNNNNNNDNFHFRWLPLINFRKEMNYTTFKSPDVRFPYLIHMVILAKNMKMLTKLTMNQRKDHQRSFKMEHLNNLFSKRCIQEVYQIHTLEITFPEFKNL